METCLELFGVKILEADDIDFTGESVQYYEATFLLESLSHYNNKTIEVTDDFKIKVWNEQGEEDVVIDQFYIIENDEFRAKLYEKYPLKKEVV